MPEVTLGVAPAQIAPFVVRRVGARRARWLMLSGARLRAAAALEAGLADVVVPGSGLRAALEADLRLLAAAEPAALRATKRIVNRTLEAPLGASLDAAAQEFAGLLRHGAAREGIAAHRGQARPGVAAAAAVRCRTCREDAQPPADRQPWRDRGAHRAQRAAPRASRTIAVCSDADRDSPHVRGLRRARADRRHAAVRVVPASRTRSSPRRAPRGAQAVHPGYGFLSENAAFAAAVRGGRPHLRRPAGRGDRRDGRQGRARGSAWPRPASRSCPATTATRRTRRGSLAEAAAHRLPGHGQGGGRRRRARHAPRRARRGPAGGAAQRRAPRPPRPSATARLILERAVVEPRHVEIQVFADAHGHVVHLGERDCSVQRRHQKIVEEAPSPAVDRGAARAHGPPPRRWPRAIGYVGAGTVEFLLDPQGDFYFMEMNTRLQVEHPVTELRHRARPRRAAAARRARRAAAGRAGGRAHRAATRSRCGCAPRSRRDDFLPRSGAGARLAARRRWRAATTRSRPGMAVSPHYDSMLAKVIAHGATRAEALDRLALALDRTALLGVPSNRAFLARVLRHPAFADGSTVSTAFIERHFPRARIARERARRATWWLAAWLSRRRRARRPRRTPDRVAQLEHRPSAACAVAARLARAPGTRTEPPTRSARAASPRAGRRGASSAAGERQSSCAARRSPRAATARSRSTARPSPTATRGTVATLWLHTRRGDFAFDCLRRAPRRSASGPRPRGGRGARGDQRPRARRRGRAGAEVAAGPAPVALEAMKMEHELRASRAGRVAAVEVAAGQQVAPGPGPDALRTRCLMSKAVVTCALTGVLTDPAQHHVPVTPEQMAREARAAFDAGASVMHVHFRQQAPGKGHLPSWDPAVAVEIAQAIRESLPGRDLQPVDGRRRARTSAARSPASRAIRPEIAACNAGSLNYLKVRSDGTWAWRPMLFDNPVEKVQAFLDGDGGNGRAARVRVLRHRHRAHAWRCTRRTGLYTGHLDYNFVMGVESGMPADPDLLPILTRLIAPDATWQVTAIGRANVWPLHRRTAELGGNLRTGLEDTFYLPDGSKATSNGQLIDAIVQTAREAGREIASPAEAREILAPPLSRAALRPQGDCHGPDAAHRGRAVARARRIPAVLARADRSGGVAGTRVRRLQRAARGQRPAGRRASGLRRHRGRARAHRPRPGRQGVHRRALRCGAAHEPRRIQPRDGGEHRRPPTGIRLRGRRTTRGGGCFPGAARGRRRGVDRRAGGRRWTATRSVMPTPS